MLCEEGPEMEMASRRRLPWLLGSGLGGLCPVRCHQRDPAADRAQGRPTLLPAAALGFTYNGGIWPQFCQVIPGKFLQSHSAEDAVFCLKGGPVTKGRTGNPLSGGSLVGRI